MDERLALRQTGLVRISSGFQQDAQRLHTALAFDDDETRQGHEIQPCAVQGHGRLLPGEQGSQRGGVIGQHRAAQGVGPGIGGAAVDVFPDEPATNAEPFDSPLRGLRNVILTPHIGGSTEEAQAAIGAFTADRLLACLNRGDTTFCVNLPNVQLAEVAVAHRLLHIHRNQPGVLAELNRAMAEAGLNILGQHLKTDERTGYVIVDVDRDYDPAALQALKGVAGTLRFRTLY